MKVKSNLLEQDEELNGRRTIKLGEGKCDVKNRNTKNHLNFQEMRRHLVEMDEREKRYYYRQACQKAKDAAALLKQEYE